MKLKLQIKDGRLFINDKEVKSIRTNAGNEIENQYYYSVTYDNDDQQFIVDGYHVYSYKTMEDEKILVSSIIMPSKFTHENINRKNNCT